MSDEKIETVKLSLTVPADVNEVLELYAEEKGIGLAEALDRLIVTAVGRLKASRKYAKKQIREGEKAAKAKAPAKKAVKKSAPKAKKKAAPKKAAPVEAPAAEPQTDAAPL